MGGFRVLALGLVALAAWVPMLRPDDGRDRAKVSDTQLVAGGGQPEAVTDTGQPPLTAEQIDQLRELLRQEAEPADVAAIAEEPLPIEAEAFPHEAAAEAAAEAAPQADQEPAAEAEAPADVSDAPVVEEPPAVVALAEAAPGCTNPNCPCGPDCSCGPECTCGKERLPRLRVYTRGEGCPGCVRFDGDALAELKGEQLWTVGGPECQVEIVIVPADDETTITPSFEWVTGQGVTASWNGYAGRHDFMSRLRRAMGLPLAPLPATTAAPAAYVCGSCGAVFDSLAELERHQAGGMSASARRYARPVYQPARAYRSSCRNCR